MPRRARPSGIFHCRGKARGHIYEHTKHVTRVGQCSKQRIDILEWSSARTLSRVFTLRFFSKGLFNSHYATFFIALTRKLWSFHSCWSKAACAFCHVSIFMGEWRGQYLDCPWDFRSKAPASQSFAEDKDWSSALSLLLRLS